MIDSGVAVREEARIINIASIAGMTQLPGLTAYCASKAAVVSLTQGLAREWASRNIAVNAIAPGYIDTEMVGAMDAKVLDAIISQIPVGRLGKGEEIADMVSWLVGDRPGTDRRSTRVCSL